LKRNQNQQLKKQEKHVMSPKELTFAIAKLGLNQLDLKIRTGLSITTISATINRRADCATLLSYLEDLGIEHNRHYNKELVRPVVYSKDAQNNESGSRVA
jgi:hypothetical protein